MEDVSTQVHERLKNLLSDWKSASAIGVAVLYVSGILVPPISHDCHRHQHGTRFAG